MALTITKNWDDGTALTESHLDDIKTSLETFVNTTKLDSNSIQTGGISAANLASGAVTAAKIDSSAVTTAKIASGAVTQAKRAALGQQVSSSCSNFSSTSGSAVDVTNLTVTITTTGRPVMLCLIADGTNTSYIGCDVTTSASSTSAYFRMKRDSTTILDTILSYTSSGSSNPLIFKVPSSVIQLVDVVAAGTYVYKLQTYAGTNNTSYVYYSKLVAYEL